MCKLTTTKLDVAELPKEISINNDWLALRERSLTQAEKVKEVTNQLTFEDAELAMKRCSTTSSSLEKVRKELVKPFNKMSKDIKKMTDEARAELEDEKKRIKGLISSYMLRCQEAEQDALEERARIEMANQAKIDKFEENPFIDEPAPVLEEVTEVEAPKVTKTLIKTSDNWTYKIEDEDLIPREFCSPDSKKINAYIKSMKGLAEIKGIKVVKETIVY